MNITNLIKIALKAMTRNKTRTFLTMLGIIIGVTSVITMLAIGEGSKTSIQGQISNMGTNMIFGEISFITKTVSPVLQLAVSLDYSIFLLHSFNDYRSSHEPKEAMVLAMKQAMPTVAASAATTVIGFAALTFMRFGIGADLGLNLVKGIILSFITIMVLLPVITLMLYKAINKTKHRKLMPDFKKSGNWLMKIRIPFLILALVVVIPSFLAQSDTQFMYGMSGITGASQVGKDTVYIEEKFGKENTLVL